MTIPKKLIVTIAALVITALATIQINQLQQNMREYSSQVEQRSTENYYAYENAAYQTSRTYWTWKVFN